MRTTNLLILAALAGCVAPETGIDHTRVRGTVVIEPVALSETGDLNNESRASANDLGEFGHQVIVLDGITKSYGYNEETDTIYRQDSDEDWYHFETAFSGTAQIVVDMPSITEDTVEWIDLVNESVVDGEGEPTEVSHIVTSEAQVVLDLEVLAGESYALRMAGAIGTANLDYTLTFYGASPEELGIMIGAYPDARHFDPILHGHPVGGSDVTGWTLQDDLSWIGSYEMLYFRVVQTEAADPESGVNPETTVQEGVDKVVLLAGDFNNLTSPLQAGMWYSGTPGELDLDSAPTETDPDTEIEYFVAEPVTLDDYVPLFVGWEVDEVEPNDVVENAATYVETGDLTVMQDLGSLTGAGFADFIRGDMYFETDEGGWFDSEGESLHDVDAFTFTVPDPVTVFTTMEWDNADADMDWLMLTADGVLIDYSAGTDKPEIGAGVDLDPDTSYVLALLGYSAPADTTVTWEVILEQVPQ